MLRHLIKHVHLYGSVHLLSDKRAWICFSGLLIHVSFRASFRASFISTSKTTTVTRVIHCLIHGGELAVQVYEGAWTPDPWITRGAKMWKMLIIGGAKRSTKEEVQVQSGGRQLWLCSFIYDRIHVKLHFKEIKLGLKGDIHPHFQPSINTSMSAHVLMRAALFFWFLSRRWSCTQTADYRYSSYSWTTVCWSWNSLNTNVMSELSSASSASVTVVHTDPGVLVQKVTSFTS